MLVFDGVTSREVLAPVEAIQAATEATVRYVSAAGSSARGYEPFHLFTADSVLTDVRNTDLLVVAGGLGSVAMMRSVTVIGWIRAQAARSRFVMSVSTGSLLLAAAGLLDDEDASGHWLAHDAMEAAGAHPIDDAVTWHGRIVTTAGPVAAAEVARTLPERLLFGPAA